MPDTFVKIASVTVGSGGASSIAFTSIPSTYTDLRFMFSTRLDSSTSTLLVDFNGVTTNQSFRRLYKLNTSIGSDSGTTIIQYTNNSNQTANTFGNGEIYIPNYLSSNFKSISSDTVNESNETNNAMALTASLWSSTATINAISLSPNGSGNFVQYSTATLYGIKSS